MNETTDNKNLVIPISEQDRKATLGCLSYVLGALYCERNSTTTSIVAGDENEYYSWDTEREGQEEAEQQHQQRQSTRRLNRNYSSRSSLKEDNQRTKDFQQYCISIAVQLLYLDSSNVVAFSATLLDPSCPIHDNYHHQTHFLHPYLITFSSQKAAFQCITLLLCRFILCSADNNNAHSTKHNYLGYDARIRAVFKALAVLLLSHFSILKQTQNNAVLLHESDVGAITDQHWANATRTFEALENMVSQKLITFASSQQHQHQRQHQKLLNKDNNSGTAMDHMSERIRTNAPSTRDKVIRGLKVGGASIAAGALFALTGGLAAPALASGVAAIAGGTVVATIVGMALSSVVAVTTVFGVGGGSLVAVKMMKRTEGLSEFQILRHHSPMNNNSNTQGLSRCICISGWLRDTFDFQRAWGVTPYEQDEQSQQLSPEEMLIRFYSVYAPDVVPACNSMILEQWKGREGKLWEALTEKYGTNPSLLLPLYGPARQAATELSEITTLPWVDEIMDALGLHNTSDAAQQQSSFVPPPVANAAAQPNVPNSDSPLAAWDYQAEYSGELYTVKWESNLLLQLNNSVKDLATNIASNATSEVLKYTVLTGIVSAVALPVGLLQICNLIDGPWTLAIERSDEAGKELAVSLLESRAAGHRPVSLVGYSFGARVIYACLIELAHHQILWEDQQKQLEEKGSSNNENARNRKTTGNSRRSHNKRAATTDAEIDIYNYKPAHYYREPASIVEDVILMGCPVSLHLRDFAKCRQIVAGRLVNCYVPNDMMLRLMFRYKQTTFSGIFRSPCGTVPVDIAGVEDYDVSKFINWHSDYCFATRSILAFIGHGQPTPSLYRNMKPAVE